MVTKKIKALIIEDSDDDLKLMLRELEKGQYVIEYKVVDDFNELSKFLEEEWDVIISDYSLPTFTGYDALMMCKEKGIDIPFIMVSGTIGEELAVSMMKAYAKDYIMKSNLVRLLPAIEREIADAKIRRAKIKADEDLKKSEEKYRTLIENMGEGITITDEDEKFVFVNQAAEMVFGVNKGELNGASLEKFMTKEGFNIVKNRTNDRRRGISNKFEEVIILKDGREKIIYVHSTPWFENNIFKGTYAIFSDITVQKNMINELIEAKEKAEEINRLKSSFLANMSHELRTPMVGILGFSEMLKDTVDVDEIKDMSDIIHRSALRLFNTLDQILNLSSLESNKFKSDYHLTDIISIVRESIDLYSKEASKKKIKLNLDSEIDSLVINTDQKMIYGSLTNLIQNAIYYTRAGSVDIKVREKMIDNNDYVIINIIDTGIGITKENIEIIFDEFRQASEGWGRSFEGTGLGLSLCRKYMNLIGGSVSVTSKPGVGSDFKLIIPKNTTCIIENSVLTKNNTGIQINDYLETEDPENKQNILYIENELDCIELVKMLLQKRYVVDSVSTGKEGIEMAAKREYSLILLDINLGKEMTGLEAMKEIRKIPYYKNIPFIAVTGFAMRGDEQEFINEGCNGYISKPFNKNILFEKISNALIQKIPLAPGI